MALNLRTWIKRELLAMLPKAAWNPAPAHSPTITGQVILADLPSSDPGVAGALYKDASNNLKVSAG